MGFETGFLSHAVSIGDGTILVADDQVWVSDEGGIVHPYREDLSLQRTPLGVGRLNGIPVYAAAVASDLTLAAGRWLDVRQALLSSDETVAAALSTALQLLAWQREHAYCGCCGAPTRPDPRERAMRCEACQVFWYPRLSPCVIVAVRRGDTLLLARSSRQARRYFSLIAGFVEPGESAEQAVVREVAEEVGIVVNNVRYASSQSWPFPHQLMLGFTADWVSGELVPDPDEIAEADWFSPAALPLVPGTFTIAGVLIRQLCQQIGSTRGGS